MWCNILKICSILSVISITWALRTRPSHLKTPKVTTTCLDELPKDMKVYPYVKVGNKLYHFGRYKSTWYKAFLRCRLEDGFLASLDTQEELTALSDYLIAQYPLDRWWWLSGSDYISEGDFYWHNTGKRISFDGWSADQPDNIGGNENCVHLWHQNNTFQMNDWICNENAYYICQRENPKSILVTVF